MGNGEHRVEVALPLPVARTFTYAISGPLPTPGSRVLVPFRRGERVGWVVGPAPAEDVPGIRDVLDVLDDIPSASPEILSLARWMADYYLAPLGVVLRGALPSVLSDSSRDYLTLVGGGDEGRTPREERLLQALNRAGEPKRVRTLRKALHMGSLWPEIRRLTARGVLRHETLPPRDPPIQTHRVVRIVQWLSNLAERDDRFGRAQRQREAYEMLETTGGSMELAHLLGEGGFSRSVIGGLEEKGVVEVVDEEIFRDPFRDRRPPSPEPLDPTRDQHRVLTALLRRLGEGNPPPALLHGVTGSGKTLVYIELLKEVVLKEGKGAIVLVPEISLTPQTVSRFQAHFGDQVAVLHSALSDGERFDAWRQLRKGEKRIAVGARSAIFAPVPRLGVVVVDEEHDGSYKQS
ncbi:MAG: primosomal protein N' family DNA-binding protein, partial [Longimicrobiales bacterium]